MYKDMQTAFKDTKKLNFASLDAYAHAYFGKDGDTLYRSEVRFDGDPGNPRKVVYACKGITDDMQPCKARVVLRKVKQSLGDWT